MKAVVQRVLLATVTVGGELVGRTHNPKTGETHGLLILIGVANGDTVKDSAFLAKKIAQMRIFEDDQGKMNQSIKDVDGSILVVSQFTLLANCQDGRRPSFIDAAPAKEAEELYLHFAEELRKQNLTVETGQFGACMNVSLTNHGPVTFVLDSAGGLK